MVKMTRELAERSELAQPLADQHRERSCGDGALVREPRACIDVALGHVRGAQHGEPRPRCLR